MKQQQVAHATVELVLFTADLNLLGNMGRGSFTTSTCTHLASAYRCFPSPFPPSLSRGLRGSRKRHAEDPEPRRVATPQARHSPGKRDTESRLLLSLTEKDGQAWVFRICN